MSLLSSNQETELGQAKIKFENWRNNKKFRGEQIPGYLWEVARELIQKYPVPVIFNQLNLSKDQALKYFCNKPKANESKTTPLVEVSNPLTPKPLSSHPNRDFQIQIQHNKGHQLSVKADKGLAYDAISAFMGTSA